MVDALMLDRDVVEVSGPESGAYLQGQLSQDVLAVDVGGSAWSWVLAPTGKVDALVRVVRIGEDRWLLDTDAEWGEALIARLTRFRLRTKVDIGPSPMSVIGVRDAPGEGPGAEAIVVAPWPGVTGYDVFRPRSPEDGAPQDGSPEDPAAVDPAVEVERILAGRPRMGAELTDKIMPAETGLVALTVSFTKGCYTGQELVARVDSRGGHAPRQLRALSMAAQVPPGTELYSGDQPAGVITSVAQAPGGVWVGLGYVRRAFEPPMTLAAGVGGPAVEMQVIIR